MKGDIAEDKLNATTAASYAAPTVVPSVACMMSVRLEDRGRVKLEHTAKKSTPIYLNVPRMMRREAYLTLIRPLMERRFATRLSTVRISDPQIRYVTSCTY